MIRPVGKNMVRLNGVRVWLPTTSPAVEAARRPFACWGVAA